MYVLFFYYIHRFVVCGWGFLFIFWLYLVFNTESCGVVEVGAQAASQASWSPQRAAVRLQQSLNLHTWGRLHTWGWTGSAPSSPFHTWGAPHRAHLWDRDRTGTGPEPPQGQGGGVREDSDWLIWKKRKEIIKSYWLRADQWKRSIQKTNQLINRDSCSMLWLMDVSGLTG